MPMPKLASTALATSAIAMTAVFAFARNDKAGSSAASVTPDPTATLPAGVLVPPDATPGSVGSVDQLVGAYIWTAQGDTYTKYKILHAVWGITEDRRLGWATLRAVDEEGNYLEYDNPGAYAELATDVSALTNLSFSDHKSGKTYEVDTLLYFIRSDGILASQYMSGTDIEGNAFEFGVSEDSASLLDEFCCTSVNVNRCVPDGGCTGNCPGPASCACTGTGACKLISYQECDGKCGDGCPGGDNQVCTGVAPTCDCENG